MPTSRKPIFPNDLDLRMRLTSMHGSHHTRDETVDTVAFLHQGNKSGDLALIVVATPEVNKDEFLESLDLILEGHQIADSLVSEVPNRSVTKTDRAGREFTAHPSFGSSMFFKLIYSSYSNNPLNSGWCR